MHRIHLSWPALAVATLCASGCALIDPPRVAGSSPGAEKIGIYDASPPGDRPYRVIRRLWIEEHKVSATRVPRYRSIEEGEGDLRNRAVALGGDAIINFGCYHIAADPRSDLICNGTVVRYQP